MAKRYSKKNMSKTGDAPKKQPKPTKGNVLAPTAKKDSQQDTYTDVCASLADQIHDTIGAGEYEIKNEDELEYVTINELRPYDWYQIECLYYKLKASRGYGAKPSHLWVRAFCMFLETQDKAVVSDMEDTELN